MSEETLAQIKADIAENKIMIYMKGEKDFPMCGFSSQVSEAFKQLGRPFKAVNILPDPNYRQVLSAHTGWPTIPQIFIDGELIGGCDIILELFQNGELKEKVEKAFADEATSAS